MNDNTSRSLFGVVGTVAGFSLENVNGLAALAASVATAAYMAFCAVEKFRQLKTRRKHK